MSFSLTPIDTVDGFKSSGINFSPGLSGLGAKRIFLIVIGFLSSSRDGLGTYKRKEPLKK